MKYYVYVLKSLRDGNCYTGITTSLERRLDEHNKGKTSTRSTLNKSPFKLVHAEECDSREEARKREIFWKGGTGREIRNLFINKF